MEERTDLMPYFYVGHAELLSKMESPDLTLGNDGKYDAVMVPGRKTNETLIQERDRLDATKWGYRAGVYTYMESKSNASLSLSVVDNAVYD